MKILCIDTSSNICSVAILDNLNIIYEHSTNDGLTHSQNLMPMIDEAFKKSSLNLADIDLYTCSIGPGSFTGIRIGVATTKAFVDVYNKPSIGISSLESLAYNVDSKYVCSIIDAKHDNVYCALFKKENNRYSAITEYLSANIDSAISSILKVKDNNITFIGDGVLIHKDKLLKSFIDCSFIEDYMNNQNAVSVGKSAYIKYINKEEIAPLSPLYLKKSQAEIMLDKKEG